MTTYATGNPIGSKAAKDLYDNAENLDLLMNGPEDDYPDRFGVARQSWRGMENDFQQVLINIGYEFIGDYDADGPLLISTRNQVFTKDGEYWRADAALVLPYITVNNWAIDQSNFVSIGDAALRSELAIETLGMEGTRLVGHNGRDLRERLLEDASLFDYMTGAEIAAAKDGTFTVDHTAAVTDAFADLQSGAISSLKINDGCRFKVTAVNSLSNINGFRIYGKGEIRQFTADTHILNLTDCSDFMIDGPRFYGLGTDYNPAAATSQGIGVYALDCFDFKIERCKFRNFGYSSVVVRNCSIYDIVDNVFIGTHTLGTPINNGEIFQFAVDVQTSWDIGVGSADFKINRNHLQDMAIGIHSSPFCRRYAICDNTVVDMRGEHGFYLNGQDITISDNKLANVPFVAIRLQSFWNAVGPTTDPIRNATITGNTVNTCRSGIHVDKTHTTSLHSNNVTITGNVVDGASNTDGEGIYIEDCGHVNVSGNVTRGGVYGIIATSKTAGEACSGIISGNTVRDTQWAGILASSDEFIDVSGNMVIRPCLAATVGSPTDVAYRMSGTTSSKRVKFKDNTLFVDTSAGVTNGLELFQVNADLGANDLDTKPILDSGSVTLRKRTLGADFTVQQVWGSSPVIAAGASTTLAIVVAGLNASDIVTYVSHSSDLQGCILSADIQTGVMNVTISNLTGGSKTIADGFVRAGVSRFGA